MEVFLSAAEKNGFAVFVGSDTLTQPIGLVATNDAETMKRRSEYWVRVDDIPDGEAVPRLLQYLERRETCRQTERLLISTVLRRP